MRYLHDWFVCRRIIKSLPKLEEHRHFAFGGSRCLGAGWGGGKKEQRPLSAAQSSLAGLRKSVFDCGVGIAEVFVCGLMSERGGKEKGQKAEEGSFLVHGPPKIHSALSISRGWRSGARTTKSQNDGRPGLDWWRATGACSFGQEDISEVSQPATMGRSLGIHKAIMIAIVPIRI